MATITIQPTGFVYQESSTVSTPSRLWDGNLDTAATLNRTSACYLRISLSALPNGSVITKIRYRAILDRHGDQKAIPRASVGYGNASSRTNVTSYVSFPVTGYNTKEEAYVDQTITETQSEQLLGNNPLLRISLASTGTTDCYEFWLDITYTPPSYALTLTANPQDGGLVSGAGIYEYGTDVSVSAIPADGYRFVGWSDGISTNPRIITVLLPIGLEAIFMRGLNLYAGNDAAIEVYAGLLKEEAIYIGNKKVI